MKLTDKDLKKAQIECDKISKQYGLDKIDKRITASTDLDKVKKSLEIQIKSLENQVSKDLQRLQDLRNKLKGISIR